MANNIDSNNVKLAYQTTSSFAQVIYNELIQAEDSPYRKYSEVADKSAQIPMEEFLWAFSICTSRSLVLNNSPFYLDEDPNAALMILPLLDYINHSFKPNVAVIPAHDKINEESYVMLRALRDIEAGE